MFFNILPSSLVLVYFACVTFPCQPSLSCSFISLCSVFLLNLFAPFYPPPCVHVSLPTLCCWPHFLHCVCLLVFLDGYFGVLLFGLPFVFLSFVLCCFSFLVISTLLLRLVLWCCCGITFITGCQKSRNPVGALGDQRMSCCSMSPWSLGSIVDSFWPLLMAS